MKTMGDVIAEEMDREILDELNKAAMAKRHKSYSGLFPEQAHIAHLRDVVITAEMFPPPAVWTMCPKPSDSATESMELVPFVNVNILPSELRRQVWDYIQKNQIPVWVCIHSLHALVQVSKLSSSPETYDRRQALRHDFVSRFNSLQTREERDFAWDRSQEALQRAEITLEAMGIFVREIDYGFELYLS